VHKNQYGFLKGRNIQDCLAWAFEFIYQCETSKKEIMLLKLDFAKAFDTIDHSAMIKIMRQMGFDEKWLKWIEIIFGTGKSAILLNGVPGRQFHCMRGVRQGDPLYPLIFVLAADLLQSAINKAFRENILHAPLSSDFGQDFPIVQYADDTLIIMPACIDQVHVMKEILQKYATSTGLTINFQKSNMIPINLSEIKTKEIADIIGCTVASMPFTYLGLPLGTTKPTIYDLMPLVDRIERKVSASFLMMSYSGRVSVINSLLASIATFAMCSIKLPEKIINHVEKIQRHCLWNKKTEDGEKCYSLAAWDKICRPKKKGGLGILNLRVQNDGLLLKYLHKFYNKVDTPWVTLIWNTYYTDKIPHALSPRGSFWWKDVFKLSHIFRGIALSSIGNGTSTLFWKDNWQHGVFEDSHPRIFSYLRKEDMSVQEFLSSDSLHNTFFLPLSPKALEELKDIQNICREVTMTQDNSDKWSYVWGNDKFSSSLYYQFYFKDLEPHIAFKWLWKARCTPKVNFLDG